MKVIRRSPVARATIWLLTLALCSPMMLVGPQSAHAQAPQVIRVLLANFVNKATHDVTDPLAVNATAAVESDLINSGQGRFDVIPRKEARVEAKAMGLRVPSSDDQPMNMSLDDLIRLAKRLNAEAIVQGEVASYGAVKNHGIGLALNVTIRDVASTEFINGGSARSQASPRPGSAESTDELTTKAVEYASQDVVRQMVQRQLVTATVLNINDQTVILNRGLRDGIKAGDDLIILREGSGGSKVREGRVHVIHSYATDSEAEVTENIGGIHPEDYARVLYRPMILTDAAIPIFRSSAPKSQFSFAAIGTTFLALGLGVLVSSAAKGGQASVTNVTAEATTDGLSAQTRVTWGDNIFGQAGVVQYHVWRVPDFPYSLSSTTNGNNGGGTGGGGGGTGGGWTPT